MSIILTFMCKYNAAVVHGKRPGPDEEWVDSRMHSGKLMKCSSSLFMLPLFSCSPVCVFPQAKKNIVYYHTFGNITMEGEHNSKEQVA